MAFPLKGTIPMTRAVNRILPFFAVAVLCSAQTTTARVEQADANITYSGTWYPNSSSSNSGGSAQLTNEEGARATVAFTGTGITWIGAKDMANGVARVYLDGVMSTVDTYGAMTEYQKPLFA